jgi:hypothetical protein
MVPKRKLWLLLLLIVIFSLGLDGFGQQTKTKRSKSKASSAETIPAGQNILWTHVDVHEQNLYDGPGGEEMRPDLTNITFIERVKGGHNKKYRIKDGSGRVWVAKPGTEARPETIAIRLLAGLGYVTEINYLVPELTIPSVGTLKNVRLEARPEGIKRLDPWKWKSNPFVGTNELQGLKIMQIFMTNNDLLDMQNQVLRVNGPNGTELHYIISDLGSTFGRFGNNSLPLFFRLGRKTDSPKKWNKAGFVKGAKNGRLILATTGAKNRGLFKDITVEQGRWLYNLLAQLDERQLRDAFRAANYSPAEIDLLVNGAKRRIRELENATGGERLAEY